MARSKPAKVKKAAKKAPAKTKAQLEAERIAAEKEAAALRVQQEATIVEDIGSGIPLAEICRREGMPSLRTVYNWQEEDAAFAARIARAREAGYDNIAAEALRIADTPQEGTRTKVGGPNGTETVTEDMLGHRKLRVETRLKLLAKWDPKRYGDKVLTELTGADGGPIETKVAPMDPKEAYMLLKAKR